MLKDHEDVKKKLEACKARNKSLSSELKNLKSQIATLLDKGKHDDELVDALLKQQAQMQDVLKRLSLQQSRHSQLADPSAPLSRSPPQAEPSTMSPYNSPAACDASPLLVHKLQRVVAEKDADIQQLKKQIQQLSLQREEAASICSTGLSPEEGDTLKETAPALSLSKFGHRLVLPAVRSSMESKDSEMSQTSAEERAPEHSGTVAAKSDLE